MTKGLQYFLLALSSALLGGWLATRCLAPRYEARITRLHADGDAKCEALERQLEEARAQIRLAAVSAPAPPSWTATPSAQPWLDRILAHVSQRQGGPEARRRLTWLFESLIALGPAAVPPIQDFLARGGNAPLDDRGDLPLNLRLAFIDALRRIGDQTARDALAALIPRTAQVWELIAVRDALGERQGNRHTPDLVSAAHRLLEREPGPDPNSRPGLYRLLAELGDQALVPQVRENLVLANGSVDRVAMDFLNHALGEEAVPDLARLLQADANLGPSDRQTVMAALALHVGKSPQAAGEFTRYLQNESVPAELRYWAIGQLNNWSPHMREPAQAGAVIRERQSLIDTLLTSMKDEQAAQQLRRMRDDLDRMLRERGE